MIEGFPGHLWTQGYDYSGRDRDLRAMYADAPNASELMRAYHVRYVVVGSLERSCVTVDDSYFRQFKVVAQTGPQTLYDTQTKIGR
jgi:uncharacterized membrane protein